MSRNYRLVGGFLIAALISSCSLFSRRSSSSSDEEIVSARTEVGTPTGEAATARIGPEGGTLTSTDGRLELTIPQNAVGENVTFSIQPITSAAGGGGIGNAYRLGPGGYKFATPLGVSFNYKDKELEGAPPEAFALSYQDGEGAWRSLQTVYIDETEKTLTASTTHFSDMKFARADRIGLSHMAEKYDKQASHKAPTDPAFLKQFHVSPEKATIYVGQSLSIELIGCEKGGLSDRIINVVDGADNCYYGGGSGIFWDAFILKPNVGHVSPSYNAQRVIYTAPSKRPDPNVVKVTCGGRFIPDGRSADEVFAQVGVTEITILDHGYRASGQTADTKYSGVVCSLEQPFTVTGVNPVMTFPFQFTPSSATTGTVSFGATIPNLVASGGGTYTVEGADSSSPRIIMTMGSKGVTPKGTRSGGGTVQIELIPLDSNECGSNN
jgi:hypothetical protein